MCQLYRIAGRTGSQATEDRWTRMCHWIRHQQATCAPWKWLRLSSLDTVNTALRPISVWCLRDSQYGVAAIRRSTKIGYSQYGVPVEKTPTSNMRPMEVANTRKFGICPPAFGLITRVACELHGSALGIFGIVCASTRSVLPLWNLWYLHSPTRRWLGTVRQHNISVNLCVCVVVMVF